MLETYVYGKFWFQASPRRRIYAACSLDFNMKYNYTMIFQVGLTVESTNAQCHPGLEYRVRKATCY